MIKRDLLAAAAGAIVATALAGGIAWAAIPEGGVIQGCYDSGGNVKVVAALPCPKGYTPLSWNQQGLKGDKGDKGDPGLNGVDGIDGQDGVSVTSTAIGEGDPNCPEGGSHFSAVNGDTYACNGAPGREGEKGDPCAPSDPACVGPPGAAGTNGVSGYEVVRVQTKLDPQQSAQSEASCPAAKHLIGGGVEIPGGAHATVRSSGPFADTWRAIVTNNLSGDPTQNYLNVFTTAICASV